MDLKPLIKKLDTMRREKLSPRWIHYNAEVAYNEAIDDAIREIKKYGKTLTSEGIKQK